MFSNLFGAKGIYIHIFWNEKNYNAIIKTTNLCRTTNK